MSCKKIIRNITYAMVSSPALWSLLRKSLVRGGLYFSSVRFDYEADLAAGSQSTLAKALASRTVLSGPFIGMKYGQAQSFCSSIYPKLLGSYEYELSGIVSASLKKNCPLVVDVGAADGYYAVGFALQMPETQIIAFEQSPRARAELRKLTATNGVQQRIEVREHCSPADLLALPKTGGLLIIDCEGYEETLLPRTTIEHLQSWDFIIETHDGFSHGITRRLQEAFSHTHKVKVVEAVLDVDKTDVFDMPLLRELSRHQQYLLLAERRSHACLRWIHCTALQHSENENSIS